MTMTMTQARTPLELALIDIWPRNSQWALAHTWRLVRAKLQALFALHGHNGIAGPGEHDDTTDDLCTLYAMALKRQLAEETGYAERLGALDLEDAA